jgi:hypothetical protein
VILLLVGLVPMLVAAATVLSIVSIARFHRNRDRRRSPLTTEMLRQPAQSLRAGLDELNDDISMYLAMALMFPFLVSTMFFADIWLRGVTLSEGRWVMYPVMGLVATVYFSMKTVSLGTQKRKFLQAIDVELVVAQELALPGWFVTLQSRGDVSVINPKKPDWMAKPMGESRLDEAQVQRIAYQLEQMSIVEPASKQMALRQSGPAGNRSPSV